MRKIVTFVTGIVSVLPSVVLGAPVAQPTNFKTLVELITNIIGTLILLIFALTFIAFMWGVIKGWIIKGGDTEGVDSGKQVVVTGIIALVIMSSIWGILSILKSSLFGG